MPGYGFSDDSPFSILISNGLGTVWFSNFDKMKPKIFLRQHRAAFFLCYGERTVANDSACLRKFWLPYSRGAGLSFFCMKTSSSPFCVHFFCVFLLISHAVVQLEGMFISQWNFLFLWRLCCVSLGCECVNVEWREWRLLSRDPVCCWSWRSSIIRSLCPNRRQHKCMELPQFAIFMHRFKLRFT